MVQQLLDTLATYFWTAGYLSDLELRLNFHGHKKSKFCYNGVMKLISFILLASLLLVATPAYAKGKPGGGGGGEVPVLKSVCIDPGHGGADNGTSNGGINEDTLNLDVSLALQQILNANGYATHITRTSDVDRTNNDRYTFCNLTNATTLVSVHHNGSTNNTIDYSAGLYQQGNSKALAQVVGQSVANEFGQVSSFRVERFPSGVLIKSNMPSMISEGYFLTNTARLNQLTTNYSEMVNREANSLFLGLQQYYN